MCSPIGVAILSSLSDNSRAIDHAPAIGANVGLDECLPFVVVHVLRAVANRTTHFQKPRPYAFEAPRSDGEPRHAQSFGKLDVRKNPILRERILQSCIAARMWVGHDVPPYPAFGNPGRRPMATS